ncbi:unnamed protein product [Cunninghamella blakesleeana]
MVHNLNSQKDDKTNHLINTSQHLNMNTASTSAHNASNLFQGQDNHDIKLEPHDLNHLPLQPTFLNLPDQHMSNQQTDTLASPTVH